MIAIVSILLAFPLGYRMRSVFAARTTYAVAYLWAFTFQTVYLMLQALGPKRGGPCLRARRASRSATGW